jgi:hypothetical protein
VDVLTNSGQGACGGKISAHPTRSLARHFSYDERAVLALFGDRASTSSSAAARQGDMAENDKPAMLSSSDARVITDSNREAVESQNMWLALQSFHRAPCLRESALTGLLGGLALGALRFATSRDPRSSITVGWTVCGLLYGTNWFVCRRAMYVGIKEEADVLNGVSVNDPEAIKRYLAQVEARDGKISGSSRD